MQASRLPLPRITAINARASVRTFVIVIKFHFTVAHCIFWFRSELHEFTPETQPSYTTGRLLAAYCCWHFFALFFNDVVVSGVFYCSLVLNCVLPILRLWFYLDLLWLPIFVLFYFDCLCHSPLLSSIFRSSLTFTHLLRPKLLCFTQDANFFVFALILLPFQNGWGTLLFSWRYLTFSTVRSGKHIPGLILVDELSHWKPVTTEICLWMKHFC